MSVALFQSGVKKRRWTERRGEGGGRGGGGVGGVWGWGFW